MKDRLTVSIRDLRRILDAADHSSHGGDGIHESVLEALQALVPCSVVSYKVVTPAREMLVCRDVGVDAPPEETDPVRLDEIDARSWKQSLACTYTFRTPERTAIRRGTDWYGSSHEYWASPFGEWLRFAGGRYSVVVPVVQRGGLDHRVCLFRDEGRDFSDRDVLLLRLLRPHLLEHERLGHQRHRVPLTGRQLQVLRLVADGLTNRQIARCLHLSEGTVRTHLMHAFKLLDIHSRAAAATFIANYEIGSEQAERV